MFPFGDRVSDLAVTHTTAHPQEPQVTRDKLMTPREAAYVLGISYPTVKQWIYKKKLRTIRTAGGHHRVPESEIDRFLHVKTQRRDVSHRREGFRRVSGRNQLVGRPGGRAD